MNLQIKASLSPECVAFLRGRLARFDFRHLEYFRLYDRTNASVTVGVWGRCKYPNRKKKLGYRSACRKANNWSGGRHRRCWPRNGSVLASAFSFSSIGVKIHLRGVHGFMSEPHRDY